MYDFPQAHVLSYKAPKFSPFLAAIMKFTDDYEASCYAELPCSEQDAAYIHEIINIVGTNNKVTLLVKRSYLNLLGTYIAHVHPMKFLTTILKSPELRPHMKPIFDDYFKRGGFMDGVAPSMTREADRDNLFQYIHDFAQDLGVSGYDLEKYFKNSDWEGLVRYLIDYSAMP